MVEASRAERWAPTCMVHVSRAPRRRAAPAGGHAEADARHISLISMSIGPLGRVADRRWLFGSSVSFAVGDKASARRSRSATGHSFDIIRRARGGEISDPAPGPGTSTPGRKRGEGRRTGLAGAFRRIRRLGRCTGRCRWHDRDITPGAAAADRVLPTAVCRSRFARCFTARHHGLSKDHACFAAATIRRLLLRLSKASRSWCSTARRVLVAGLAAVAAAGAGL